MTAPDAASGETPDQVALRDLHRVLLLVNAGQSLAEVIEAAARGVADVLGFGNVAVNLLTDRGDFEVVTVIGPAEETLLGSRNDRDDFLAELAVADEWGLLRFVPSGRYDDGGAVVAWRSQDPPAAADDAWQPDDALYAPLHGPGGELTGILSVDLPRGGRRPDAHTRQLLEMYAVQMGLAFNAARERDRLRERVRLAAATHRVVQTAAASQDLDRILARSVHPLREGFRSDRVWIRLFADEGGAWEAVNYPPDLEQHLVAPDDPRPGRPERVEQTLLYAAHVARTCWSARRTLVVAGDGPDTSEGIVRPDRRERVLGWLRRQEESAFVLVPLGAGEQCLGYAVLTRSVAAGDWTPAEEAAAQDVGRELGRVIGTARVRERERELVRRLEDLDAHKSQVFATVVHELQNPLTAILGSLELVREDPAVAERAHATIESSSTRMLTLVQDVLALSRLEDPDAAQERTDVDLGALVRRVHAQLGVQARRAGIEWDLDAVVPGVVVRLEEAEAERMVLNLVSNAVKFSEAGGVVTLALEVEDDQVTLRCTDTGLGIGADELPLLFEEFARSANPDARRRPGSGLGLAIAERIARRHGGRIEVESTLGAGSTFRVVLPRR